MWTVNCSSVSPGFKSVHITNKQSVYFLLLFKKITFAHETSRYPAQQISSHWDNTYQPYVTQKGHDFFLIIYQTRDLSSPSHYTLLVRLRIHVS